jgi:hypothetical protein
MNKPRSSGDDKSRQNLSFRSSAAGSISIQSPKKKLPAPKTQISGIGSPKKSKPTPKPKKDSKYNDNFINRFLEDWSKPLGFYPEGDIYPYGSLTGRGR